MTFLTALAFLITVLSGSAEIGMIASLSVWAVQVVRLKSDDLGPFAIYWPDLLATASHPVLWGLTLLLAAVALWLGGQEEHWIKGIRR
jgi:hypothetical protein